MRNLYGLQILNIDSGLKFDDDRIFFTARIENYFTKSLDTVA